MKAVVCRKFGPPEVLQISELEKPSPGDNEVLIKVHATSVTTGDVNARGLTYVPPGLGLMARIGMGLTKPKWLILGSDLAGTIEATGREVRRFSAGDQVYGINGTDLGAYAQYACWAEDRALVEKPSNLTFEEAAAVPFGATTALYFLRDLGNIQSGQRVLINGASGGVGTAAVQLAKAFGAEVTGVCSTAKLDTVRSLGADQVIDYTQEDFTQNGERYDAIFDAVVGKTSFSRCKRSLAPGGLYLAVAGGLKEMLQMPWTAAMSGLRGQRNGKRVVFGGGEASERQEILLFIKELIEAGKFKPVIDRSYPLEQIAEAHRYVEHGHKVGNVIINVAGD